MVQIRVMDDDPAEVRRVLEILLPLVDACPLLHAGSTTRLSHRGGGGRVVFDLSPLGHPAGPAAPVPADTVTVERADPPARAARSRRAVGGGRLALPPGR